MRSAQYHCAVQYIFQRVQERHQRNLGVRIERHSAPDWGTWRRLQFKMSFAWWGMALISWFYLFNIQVRANCTTACNIQAALQYVELTHVYLVQVSFFSVVCFTKRKCACSLEQVPETCWPRLFSLGGRSLRAERMDERWCPDRSVWLVTFTFTEMHEENCERLFFRFLFHVWNDGRRQNRKKHSWNIMTAPCWLIEVILLLWIGQILKMNFTEFGLTLNFPIKC